MKYVKEVKSEAVGAEEYSMEVKCVESLEPFQEKNETGEVVFKTIYNAAEEPIGVFAEATYGEWYAVQSEETKALNPTPEAEVPAAE